MEVSGAGRYFAVQNRYAPRKEESAIQADAEITVPTVSPNRDTVEISGGAEYLKGLRERFPRMSSSIDTNFASGIERNTGDNAAKSPGASQKSGGFNSNEESGEDSDVTGGGMTGINVQRLARQLASAKTQDQVRAVIAQIQSDLRECDSGEAQGMDVDETSYEAAQRLLREARSRMGQMENREPTPEEEMAYALASLM